MEKYIFLTGFYLPKPGATGLCVHQMAKEAAARGNDVTVICYADGDHSPEFDGVKIVYIKGPAYQSMNISGGSAAGKLNYINSLLRKLIYIRQYPLRSMGLVRRFCQALEKELGDSEQAVVMASVNPLEAVVAADRVKKENPKRIKTIYYCADTLSNERGSDGILSAEYRTKCGLRWERKLFQSFDRVFIMECHKDHYLSDEFAGLTHKMEIVNFPLFTRVETLEKKVACEKAEAGGKKCGDVIQLTYVGTLYRILRNPKYLCGLLVDLSGKMKIHVSFLGSGDCDDILDEAAAKTNGAIERLGMVTHDTALQYLAEADVLLSIGNNESPMVPSKIYEYMASGKPIIHLFKYDGDPCLEPLRRYGNALLIREGDPSGVERIPAFIANSKLLDFEGLKKKFETSTPEYSVNLIENM